MKTVNVSFSIIVIILLTAIGTASAWTTPAPLSEVNTQYTELVGCISYDGLTLYFPRSNTDAFYYTRIYQATRQQASGPFSNVQELSNLNYSGGHVSSPWVTSDNLRMYYFRTEPGSVWRLKMTQRASASDPWMPGNNITELNALGNVNLPTLSQDELTIVFAGTNVSGGMGSSDLYMATRSDKYSSFSSPFNLTQLNSAGADQGAWLSPNGLTLFYMSDRTGTHQLYKSTRLGTSEAFSSSTLFTDINFSATPLGSGTFSADGSTFYFDSGQNIYVSQIPEPATMVLLALGGIFLRKVRC